MASSVTSKIATSTRPTEPAPPKLARTSPAQMVANLSGAAVGLLHTRALEGGVAQMNAHDGNSFPMEPRADGRFSPLALVAGEVLPS